MSAATRRVGPAIGLTLVELLVTLSLLTLVAGAAVAIFSGGIQVWQRIENRGPSAQWLQVTFAQVQRDLHNARRFKPIRLEGRYDALSFAALVPAPPPEGTAEPVQIDEELGRVGYYFDWGRRMLCRSQTPYRLIRKIRLRDACSPVLSDIERVQFSYYGFDAKTKNGGWHSEWTADELPLAVKLEVSARDAAKRPTSQSLVIRLPIAAVR